MKHTASALLLVISSLAQAAEEPRRELSLNGTWQCQLAGELGSPPASGTWKPCTVPGYLSGTDYQRAWLRRTFTVPEAMRGQRIKLHFGGVKFNSRVHLNGKQVGGCFGGYEPFELDVTGAVRFDGPNELAVGCHDWTGVFTPGKVEFPKNANWDATRGAPRDKILSPIGGLFGLYGIWDDVTLRAHPAVYVKDLFIKPSVRRKELVIDYTLANESGADVEVELRAAVEDQGKDVLQLPATRLKIPAQKSATATLRQPWANPPLWSHVDPHLLHLRTTLSAGDQLRTRFGFREFWTEGHRFFLNGARVNLLATSWWPPHGPMTREEIRKQWEAVKRMNAVAFRTHTQPWPSLHYEVADEVGLLMIPEGAVWNDDDTYRIYDPVFWDNYARHLCAMVDRDKNRPSVVMWSLENEFLGGRLNDASLAKRDLVRMGRLVKEHDPTRPILYESDGDPGGVADVIGIHYPHEYPDFTCWPNEAWWLEKPATIPHMFLNGEKEFVWKKDKPLYIGEFLWIPSRDPSWHTVFFGDEAYEDYHRYRNLAKAEAWKMQILGYRHLEVGGISPWTVIEGGPLDDTNPLYKAHQEAYQPIAAYPLEYDSRFYVDKPVTRRLAVFNDILEPSKLRLKWTLRGSEANQAYAEGEKWLSLGPGEHHVVDVQLRMRRVQDVNGREVLPWGVMQWRLEIERDGCRVFEAVHPWETPSRLSAASSVAVDGVKTPVFLYDPLGRTKKALETLGLSVVLVPTLEKIGREVTVLVIGANTLRTDSGGTPVIGRVRPERKAIQDFVVRGGRLGVLHQDSYPEGLFDVQLTDHRSTMAFDFDQESGGGFLGGYLGDEGSRLKFWGGDHLVATKEPTRPTCGGFEALVVSGSAAGIDHAPLLLQHMGQGCIVHCQLLAVEKFAAEPAAARALDTVMFMLFNHRQTTRPTAVFGGGKPYRDYLRSLGLRFRDVTQEPVFLDSTPNGLLIARGDTPPAEKLVPWVKAGGSLFLHRPSAASLEKISRAFNLDLVARPCAGPVSRAEDLHPLLSSIAREDLYWLGKHEGIDWADTPRAAGMADVVFTRSIEGKQPAAYDVKHWKLEGGLVERQAQGVVFATVGSASQEIDFPAYGRYLIGVLARGTPCFGVYPLVQVSVNGYPVGVVPVTDRWETACVQTPVYDGRHKISIAFANDASDPPREDRNLYVDKVLIARDDDANVDFLTSPAAIATTWRGERSVTGRGIVLIDEVRWDTEERNARKAARFASSLLTALDGDFQPRLGTTIECETMTPQPGMPHFSNQGGHAAMACNGYVKTPIQVAAAGRYTMELVASGTPAAGVYPLVEIALDGKKAGQVQLTSGAWRSYFLDLDLPAGQHELRLSFVNDLNAAGEDRNVMLDKVVFFRD